MTAKKRGPAAAARDDRALAPALATHVSFTTTGDPLVPFCARVGAAYWAVRLNDFPEEPLYTLLIDDEPVGDFDDWPATWRKPAR